MPVLTVPSVRKYAAGTERREIPDSKAAGLYLIIQPKPKGTKTWALRFRRPVQNGKRKPAKMTLGRVDLDETETSDKPVIGGSLTLRQARVLAAEIDRQRAQGLDVIEEYKAAQRRKSATEQDRAANVFGSLVRKFFVEYRTRKWKTRPRRWRDDAALLGLRWPAGSDPATVEPEFVEGGLAKTWQDKPVADLDGHHIHTVIAELGDSGRARKTHAVLSVFFAWLLKQPIRPVASNLAAGVHRPGPPPPRERVLTDDEIVAFWRGCDGVNAPFGALFKFMLITGCRLREAAGMKRVELSQDGIWVVPALRSKNHREFSLSLPPLALDIINSLPVIEGGYVFTTRGDVPVSGFSVAKRQLDAAITKVAGHAVEDFRLHDLRRTCATNLAKLGVALPVIERCLNHTSGSFGGIVGVYQKHEFADEKADALQRWAKHLIGLTAQKSDKAVSMRGRRGK